ncbi:sulfotransferase [Persicimonas caeni]|uniref:Sulfotransferase n=1 Tax=Persicimonas caeni TaxID=2292766 RepID=A0A4Y6PZ37_PERCE|nr:sulfotransferase [Persicimonas caeni]QED34744.1 sulfotransferase [Persicimonas caeni]
MARPAERDPIFVDQTTLRAVAKTTLSITQPDLRRIGWALGLFAAHRMVYAGVRMGRALDDVLFPGYRDRDPGEPIFIVAAPRSGTTFLHRLMSLDDDFAHFKLYHTILPSVSIIRLIHGLERLDKRVGGPLRWALDKLEGLAFDGWDGIHQLGFSRPEEDEGLFVLTLLSPGLYLLLHELDAAHEAGFVDTLPAPVRERLARYYRDSVQRIFEAEQSDGQLLDKSVLMAGRLETMRTAFPQARFVHLVRHPYKSIPSFVSMFRAAWAAVSPSLPEDGAPSRRLAMLAIDYYKRMHRARSELGPGKMTTIRFDDLVSAPEATLERIYAWLDRPLTDDVRRRVREELARADKHTSSHSYSLEQYGLSKGFIAHELREVFDTYGFEP